MFHPPLMRFFSLTQGGVKAAYSLFFKMDKAGKIDFGSVDFRPTAIEVSKNYFHKPSLQQVK